MLFLERISGIIVAGGKDSLVVHFLTGDSEMKQLPNLPRKIYGSSMFAQSGTILLCGGWGNVSKCLQMDHGTWKEHSTFNRRRAMHSAVSTQTATFVFGGYFSEKTYEYLPKDSTRWRKGKTKIPGGFRAGCAFAVKSEQEIWLIGSFTSNILSFNVNDHTFQVLPFRLNVERWGHKCAFIPNTNKLMITGGSDINSTEILDFENGIVTMASPTNFIRHNHGFGVITINGQDRLAVLGGDWNSGNDDRHDSIELFNPYTEKWEITDFKMNYRHGYGGYGFLTVKLSNIK